VNSTDQIRDTFIGMSIPSLEGPPSRELTAAINKLLELYPDIPALGSPYGTGNNTFGLNTQYKRLAALCEYFNFSYVTITGH
jgi:acetylcholinesterase